MLADIVIDDIGGTIPSLPSSLHTATALVLASMTGERSLLIRASLDDEVILLLHALQSMGLETKVDGGDIEVDSCNMGMRAEFIDVGNSLTVFSLASALASNIPRRSTISGKLSPSVSLHHYVNALLNLGVNCEFPREDWSLPMNIRGPHRSHMTHIPGLSPPIFISALVLGSLFSVNPTRIELSPPNRGPILHPNDRDLMLSFGIEVETGETYVKTPGGHGCRAASVRIPSDDMLNTFFICLGMMHGEIRITSIVHPPPAYECFKNSKANVSFQGGIITARKGEERIFEIRIDSFPETLPLIITMATSLPGTTRIETEDKPLLPEESKNLLRTLSSLKRMGCNILKNKNTYFVPETILKPCRLRADNHIIALAQLLAASTAQGSSMSNIDVLLSRYPGIVSELKSLGLTLNLKKDDDRIFLLGD